MTKAKQKHKSQREEAALPELLLCNLAVIVLEMIDDLRGGKIIVVLDFKPCELVEGFMWEWEEQSEPL